MENQSKAGQANSKEGQANNGDGGVSGIHTSAILTFIDLILFIVLLLDSFCISSWVRF